MSRSEFYGPPNVERLVLRCITIEHQHPIEFVEYLIIFVSFLDSDHPGKKREPYWGSLTFQPQNLDPFRYGMRTSSGRRRPGAGAATPRRTLTVTAAGASTSAPRSRTRTRRRPRGSARTCGELSAGIHWHFFGLKRQSRKPTKKKKTNGK